MSESTNKTIRELVNTIVPIEIELLLYQVERSELSEPLTFENVFKHLIRKHKLMSFLVETNGARVVKIIPIPVDGIDNLDKIIDMHDKIEPLKTIGPFDSIEDCVVNGLITTLNIIQERQELLASIHSKMNNNG